MSLKRVLYALLIAAVAVFSALSGVVAGGVAVYKALGGSRGQAASIIPSSAPNTDPGQTLVLSSTDIETSITQAAQKVGTRD